LKIQSIIVAALIAVLTVVFSEGCTTNSNSLTGVWKLVSVTVTDSSQTIATDSDSVIGSLILNANFTFTANGTIISQSVAETLGVPIGYNVTATGGYSYSGAYNTISFDLVSWSGKGNSSGSAEGTYKLSGNSLLLNLSAGSITISANLVRTQ